MLAVDRLEPCPVELDLVAPADAVLLLLLPVLADLVDRLVQGPYALQEHQRPGGEGLPGRPQPADDPDLRQRAGHEALLAERGPAGLLEGPVEEDRRREGHAREELRGAVVAQAARCVHPVEPGRRAREQPDQEARAEGRVAVAGLADREHRAEHGGAVEAEGDQVLPAPGEVEVLPAEADESVEGQRRGDRGAAEEEDVGSGAVDRLLASAALLTAFPGVLCRGLVTGALPAREHRHRRQDSGHHHATRKQPVQRYVGQSHAVSLASQ